MGGEANCLAQCIFISGLKGSFTLQNLDSKSIVGRPTKKKSYEAMPENTMFDIWI